MYKRRASHLVMAVFSCFVFVSNSALATEVVTSTTAQAPPPTTRNAPPSGLLNLGSHTPSVANTGLPALSAAGHPVALGAQITPAQALAASQILSSGRQLTVLDTLGAAVGGSLLLPKLYSGDLIIPKGVTVVSLTSSNANTNVLGNLFNSGSLLFASTNSANLNSTLNARNITNNAGGIISSAVTSPQLLGFAGALSGVNLNLNASGQIENHGTISSGGNLALTSKTGQFVNSGTISSEAGNVAFSTGASRASISIDNHGGTISAQQGNINVATAGKQNANVTVQGGDLLSQQLNVTAHGGKVLIDAQNVTGQVNITDACGADVRAATNNLILGTMNVNGDPTFFNTAGSVTLSGRIATNGAPLAIIASQDIYTVANNGTDELEIDTTSVGGSAGSVLMVAGAAVSSNGASQGSDDHTTTLLFSGPSATGGAIDLTTNDGMARINADGHGSQGFGGNVTLAAYSGNGQGSPLSLVPGTVHLLSTSTVSANAEGQAPYCGNISIIGGAPASAGTAVSVGNVSSTGDGPGGGTVSIVGAAPVVPSGFSVQIVDGVATGPFTYDTNGTGNIAVAGTVTGRDVVVLGHDATISQVNAANSLATTTNSLSVNATVGSGGATVNTTGSALNLSGTLDASGPLTVNTNSYTKVAQGAPGTAFAVSDGTSNLSVTSTPSTVNINATGADVELRQSMNLSDSLNVSTTGSGNIRIYGVNLTAGSAINLAANGSGSIDSIGFGGALSAPSVNLLAVGGNVGSSFAPIAIGSGSSVTVNANSQANISGVGSLNIGGNSSANTLTISAVNDITASAGVTLSGSNVNLTSTIGSIGTQSSPITTAGLFGSVWTTANANAAGQSVYLHGTNVVINSSSGAGSVFSVVADNSLNTNATITADQVVLQTGQGFSYIGGAITANTISLTSDFSITNSIGIANFHAPTLNLVSTNGMIDVTLPSNIQNISAQTLSFSDIDITAPGAINFVGTSATGGPHQTFSITAGGIISQSPGATITSDRITFANTSPSTPADVAYSTTPLVVTANFLNVNVRNAYISVNNPGFMPTVDVDASQSSGLFQLTSNGSIYVTGAVTAASVNFTAVNDIVTFYQGSIGAGGDVTLTSTNGTIGGPSQPVILAGPTVNVIANAPYGVYLSGLGAVNIGGNSSAGSSTFSIAANNNITGSIGTVTANTVLLNSTMGWVDFVNPVTANTISVTEGFDIDSRTNLATLQAPTLNLVSTSGNITVTLPSFVQNVSAQALSSQPKNVSITAPGAINFVGTSGTSTAPSSTFAVTAGGAVTESAGATITSNTITFANTAPGTPADVGTAASPLNVSASNLTANVRKAFISNTGAVSLNASSLTDQLQLSSTGSITIAGKVTATNAIVLNGGGAITEFGGATITAPSVTFGQTSSPADVGSSAAPFTVSASTISANVRSAYITNSSAVSLANSSLTDQLQLTSPGQITVTGAVSATNALVLKGTHVSIPGSINAGFVTLLPYDSTANMSIGGTYTYNVAIADLAKITAYQVTVGSLGSTGSITVASTIAQPTGTPGTTANVYTLNLESATGISILSPVTADGFIATTPAAINVAANVLGRNGVTLSATGAADVYLRPTVVVSTTNSPIAITANNIQFTSTGNAWIAAGTSTVSLMPSGNQLVTIAGSGTFNVTTNMLNRVVASQLIIGSLSDTNNMILQGAVLEPVGTPGTTPGVYALTLQTGGAYAAAVSNPSLNTRAQDLTINAISSVTTGTGGINGGDVLLNSSQPTAGSAGVYVNGAIVGSTITLRVQPSSPGYVVMNANLTATSSINVDVQGTGYAWIGASKTYQTTNGPITINANSITWANIGTSVIKAGTYGTVTLKPSQSTQPVSVGGSTGFWVPTTALPRIIGGKLVIGTTSNTAGFTLDGSYTLPASGTVGVTGGLFPIEFQTGGNYSSATTPTLNMQGQALTITALGSLATGTVTGNATTSKATLIGQTISQVTGSISTHEVVLQTSGGNIYGTSTSTPFATTTGKLSITTPGSALVTNTGALQLGNINVGALNLATTGAGANITTTADMFGSGVGTFQITSSGSFTLSKYIITDSNLISLNGTTGVTINSGTYIQTGSAPYTFPPYSNADITASGAISITAGTSTTPGNVVINGGGIYTYGTTTSPGDITIVSQNGSVTFGAPSMNAIGGNIKVFATGNITGSGGFYQANAVGDAEVNPTVWAGGGIEFGAGTTPAQSQLAAAFSMPAGTVPSTSLGSNVAIYNNNTGAVVANLTNGGSVNLSTSGTYQAGLQLQGGAIVFDANNASIQFNGGSWSTNAFAPIAYEQGEMLLTPAEDIAFAAPHCEVRAKKNSSALISIDSEGTRVIACSGPGDVSVVIGNRVITLMPGEELFVSNSTLTEDRVAKADGIGRRAISMCTLPNGISISRCQVALLSVMMNNPHFARIAHPSNESERKMQGRILKTCAAIQHATANQGNYRARSAMARDSHGSALLPVNWTERPQ